jgi:hypothetical protein
MEVSDLTNCACFSDHNDGTRAVAVGVGVRQWFEYSVWQHNADFVDMFPYVWSGMLEHADFLVSMI